MCLRDLAGRRYLGNMESRVWRNKRIKVVRPARVFRPLPPEDQRVVESRGADEQVEIRTTVLAWDIQEKQMLLLTHRLRSPTRDGIVGNDTN